MKNQWVFFLMMLMLLMVISPFFVAHGDPGYFKLEHISQDQRPPHFERWMDASQKMVRIDAATGNPDQLTH